MIMEKGERKFSGDEDFVRSLEPDYGASAEQAVSDDPKGPVVSQGQEDSDTSASGPASVDVKSYGAPKHHQNFHPHRKRRFEIVSIIFMVFLFVFLIFLSASTGTNPFVVLLSMMPTILTIVVALLIYESLADNRHVLWVLPLILSFVFNWYGKSSYTIFPNIDVDVLTALNVVLSFLYLVINYFALQQPIPKDKEVIIKEVVKEADIPFELTNFIASIEDKSKALNFVIGRVYNSYHGGSRALREKINMKQDWYDQFSQIPSDVDDIDFDALEKLVSKIEERLLMLNSTEREVFGDDCRHFKNLVRDEKGRDRIIDVLDRNDKDPVVSYYEGALQFCGKVRDYIAQRSVPEVKNDYVQRPDENVKKAAPRSSKWNWKRLFR